MISQVVFKLEENKADFKQVSSLVNLPDSLNIYRGQFYGHFKIINDTELRVNTKCTYYIVNKKKKCEIYAVFSNMV